MDESTKSSVMLSPSVVDSIDAQLLLCQQCHVKLNLDVSFKELDKFTLIGIRNSFNTESSNKQFQEEAIIIPHFMEQDPETIDCQQFGTIEDISPQGDANEDNQNGFLLLGETGGPGNLGLRHKIYEQLFKFLNNDSPAEHPLCQACADKLMDLQAAQLGELEEECSSLTHYLEYLNTIEGNSNQSSLPNVEENLLVLEQEEEALREEMAALKITLEEVKTETAVEQDKNKALTNQNNELQQYYSELKRQLFLLEDDRAGAMNQLKFAEAQLNRLSKTNLLNAAFHIWHDGHFATINGFRLGRLASVPVEWSEINAALGQCALLLSAIAKQIDYQFERFEIRPIASSSEIISRKDRRRLPLFSSPTIFTDSKFDLAITAFLSCLSDLQNYLKLTYNVTLPHAIYDKGFIEENKQAYSVRIQNNSDEKWTKALRLMLQNMKWIISWLSTLSPDGNNSRKIPRKAPDT